MVVRVQREDFDVGAELATFTDGNKAIGGVCLFVGLVRDLTGGEGAMTLEHYPGMTEKQLEKIEAEARKRWPLENSLIIHRFGRLEAGEQIVLVAAASAHRDAAFQAARFLMDWLKTQAPFWKQEHGGDGDQWVEAKDSDDFAAQQWNRETNQ
ncbi:molybdenum cofactor biosynthesis protein MoaE [Magnetospira sp. QH-2]|uniref:molybdenum cofactor biosynthesis protein MoaE n=1 Tax=Magnetospira sp. (strain QH-2) TaxID=1288970 RepID=UPI0003E813A1|nr:molybdenum cofactor biosynthesis protein MoaE [Magnetospira sp. QH-2]CCQ74865.1 Molybdopterin-converting factor subunit 2 [Magnetospira sp. QH-2]